MKNAIKIILTAVAVIGILYMLLMIVAYGIINTNG